MVAIGSCDYCSEFCQSLGVIAKRVRLKHAE